MTIFIILIISVLLFSLFSRLVGPILLNIAGIPGALVGYKSFDKKQTKYIIGSIIAAVGQCYLYITFMIYTINLSQRLIEVKKVNKYFIWVTCFIVLIGTIQQIRHNAKKEFKENKTDYENPQLTALLITEITSFIGFFIIVFYPPIINPLWSWVNLIPFPI